MSWWLSSQGLGERRLSAERLKRPFYTAHHGRDAFFNLGYSVGRGRQELQALMKGFGVRSIEGWSVHHYEILVLILFGPFKPRAFDADDLNCQSPGSRDRVVEQISGNGRKPHDGGVCRRLCEKSLREFFRQSGKDLESTLENAMALRMHGPYRMPIVRERLVRDFSHCPGNRVGRLLFVLVRPVDIGRISLRM